MVNRILFILLVGFHVAHGQDTTRVSLLFVGDVMQHDSQIKAAYDPIAESYNYSECFQYVKPIIQQADIAMANLEVTLAGPPYKGYPQFSAPDALALELKAAGFDVLVTANNHCVDRRKKGLERTIDVLDSLGIAHTGTFKDSLSRAQQFPLIVEKKEFRFSLLNYTYGTNGMPVTPPNVVNLIDTTLIKSDLIKAKQQLTDAVIVFMHWGSEYQDTPNSSQKSIAEFCFKNGATLVVGSHPHVLQPMAWDKENDRLVAYSLGNFVSGQQSRYRDGGAMLWVDFEKIVSDSTKKVSIKNAAYDLAWVYRNQEAPKKYFIWPMKEFESDTLRYIPKTATTLFNLFAKDSRKLLAKNKSVVESKRKTLEINYYKILLATLPDDIKISDSSALVNFYGLYSEYENDSLVNWVTGKFYDREIAEQALAEITSSTSYTNAKIVWYYWGARKEELLSSK